MTNEEIDESIKYYKHVKRVTERMQASGIDLPGKNCNANIIKYSEMAISALERDRWIPVTERLPENKVNPITDDAYVYQCTASFKGKRLDVRYYKFWDGHWWNGLGNVDEYVTVTAWKERPEPYTESEETHD